MSITVYEKIPNGLYPTGQRTVSTFPSGLIRVDQTFVCKTSAAATNRATLAVGNNFPGDSAPALDGLKIFPEVQERRRDDGFTEFIVSAYGRTTISGRINTTSISYRRVQLVVKGNSGTDVIAVKSQRNVIEIIKVIQDTENYSPTSDYSLLSDPTHDLSGFPSNWYISTSAPYNYNNYFSLTNGQSFGSWKEITVNLTRY